MGKKSEITKEKIVEAARELFIQKGYAGLRMQELADLAGVNKGLLHHYFKNKSSLFEAIFTEAIHELFGVIASILQSDLTAEEKFDQIVDNYLSMLKANPQLPIFVLSELQRDPQAMLNAFQPQELLAMASKNVVLEAGVDEQKMMHVIITIASLCVFPFMARPILEKIKPRELSFDDFIEERRPIIKSIIHKMLES